MMSASKDYHLSQLYRDGFLDYASYVILERAVPHIDDGLKPVQRRILHALWEMEDGRFNKVANVVGSTMRYHPHGDASIGDALVTLAQKDLGLLETQGNFGNILTGDSAAAPRYIETRLSKLALEVVFNPKTTQWQSSYDGRNKEPVTLPVKFPLLLAQGTEGIAVGLACKILPHNFNELIAACIGHLQGQPIELLPDFPTGGLADVTEYQQGRRGGRIRVRARIEERGKYLLAITDIPFGTTTKSLMESIVTANAKEKIKIRKIEDNTAEKVEILLHLPQGADAKKTIGALYVFTDCEVSHSPNACVIRNGKPEFLETFELLRASADRTVALLKQELEIRLNELDALWHNSSLEKIFIEKALYRLLEKADSEETAIALLQGSLAPYRSALRREITKEDMVRLIELRFRRLAKYDASRAEEEIVKIEAEIQRVKGQLANITDYAIAFFRDLQRKFGAKHPRKTEIVAFDSIVAAQVAIANEKLYVDRAEGFVGYGLKDQELVGNCSTIDELIAFFGDGTMKVNLVSEKAFFGKGILHVAVFKKGDEQTIYNLLYEDGTTGHVYAKRFFVSGITRDKLYALTQGTPGSRVVHFSVNPNGECEKIRLYLAPNQGARKTQIEYDFSGLAVKNRNAQGNQVSKYRVKKVRRCE